MSEPQFLYQFTDEERAAIQRRFSQYMQAVEVIAELHGLHLLGVQLQTDPQNRGFIAPPGMEIKKGETQ